MWRLRRERREMFATNSPARSPSKNSTRKQRSNDDRRSLGARLDAAQRIARTASVAQLEPGRSIAMQQRHTTTTTTRNSVYMQSVFWALCAKKTKSRAAGEHRAQIDSKVESICFVSSAVCCAHANRALCLQRMSSKRALVAASPIARTRSFRARSLAREFSSRDHRTRAFPCRHDWSLSQRRRVCCR